MGRRCGGQTSAKVGRRRRRATRSTATATSRGGVDLPKDDIDRVKSHLAKYYKKMGETAPWERG